MQRYFITAESTYEDLRQALNVQLAYPNALGKSVFQTALQAPRDGFRRVLLAVDTDLPNYTAVSAAISPLIDSDAMEEIDEATYLAAVASAATGTTTWEGLTGKPGTFPPSTHSHEIADVTGLQSALNAKASLAHSHGFLQDAGDLQTSSGSSTSGTIAVVGAAGLPSAGKLVAASQLFGLTVTALPANGLSVVYGTSALTACQGNDARLSNARTPVSHTHSVTDITATGTPSATTYLRGDGSWQTVSGGGSSSASDLTSGTLANSRLTTRIRSAANLYLWATFR